MKVASDPEDTSKTGLTSGVCVHATPYLAEGSNFMWSLLVSGIIFENYDEEPPEKTAFQAVYQIATDDGYF